MKTASNKNNNKNNNLQEIRLNPDWAKLPLFDRKGWQRLPFGAFAESINERVDPGAAGDEIYVGLEHLDPQDLHIRRWGKGSDVIGTKLRFRKGDLIFGRRRAYQRKLAVAEFDGICSAHAMVVRAKTERVLPEFLPFLMMSDRFMKRAVEISVGSLSPTINWKTLKLEEFDLPPLDQQRRVAEILWAANTVNLSYKKTQMICVEIIDRRLREYFGDGQTEMQKDFADRKIDESPTTAQKTKIGELCEITSSKRIFAADYVAEGVPFYRGKEIIEKHKGNLEVSTELFISESKFSEITVKFGAPVPGDLLLTSVGTLGVPYIVRTGERFYFKDGNLTWFRKFDGIDSHFLYYWLMSPSGKASLQKSTIGSSQSALTIVLLKNMEIYVPPQPEQRRFVEEIETLHSVRKGLETHALNTRHLLNSIIDLITE